MPASTPGLPAETRVGRVALRVTDPDPMAEFYETVVGLERSERTDERVVLGAGGEPLVELHADPDAGERPPEAAGLFHAAFRVPDRVALADALARVEEHWQLDGASDHRVSEALYLADPEGNGIEVYRDRPRAEWPTTGDGRVGMETLPLELAGLRERVGGESTVPDGTDVGHVHLEVTSIAAARAFYVDALGMNVRQTYGDEGLFVAAGDYHHHVGANVWNGRTAPASGRGLAWFELVVPDDGFPPARDRLVDAGYDVAALDDGVEVTDPDGIHMRMRAAD